MTEAQFQRFCDFALESIPDPRWLRVDEGIRHLHSIPRTRPCKHGPPKASLQWFSMRGEPAWQSYDLDSPVRGLVYGYDAIDALEQYVELNLIGEMGLDYFLQ